MNDPVYKTVEITGTSSQSLDDAVRNGLATTAKTLRHLAWFEVSEIRGQIEGSEVKQWQTTLKVGFRIEAAANG
jgi:flavin-binding protein dodecin